MKRLALLALLSALAPAAFAGLSYDFRSDTAGGSRASALSGRTSVEGNGMRMDLTKGDGTLFQDGAVVLSDDAGKTLHVLNPSDKTYYDLALYDLLGGAASVLKQLGSMVKVTFTDPKVSAREAGDGGKIEGYPTKHSFVDSSYVININMMGQKMTMPISTSTEVWTTREIGAEYANFLQASKLMTGIEDLDKVIASHLDARAAGFPLKQVTTVKVTQGGKETTSVTTMTVSGIRKETVPPARFALPSGYTKVASPIEALMKRVR
ncbi:MAG TPA: DUF4412 domain-containing protein [Thermoanaerobaculia bacterium]|jgi:hypothetical protein|nr:DUF4412 domain-containing protein [Thermoanaerobaculia bacterium]